MNTHDKLKDFFKGKKILIWGLGLNQGGVGMVKFLAQFDVSLKITDLRTKEKLKPSLKQIQHIIQEKNIELILGKHNEKDFEWADIIIRNPAIPPHNKLLKYAQTLGKEIYMEMALFFKFNISQAIGITGTKGKSTTTTLIYEILKQHKPNTHLAGNIGKSAVQLLPAQTTDHITVLELSSYQLDVMREHKQSPNIAVITNIYQDHLNWHGSLEHYIRAKLAIVQNQPANGYAVINLDSPTVLQNIDKIPSRIIGITQQFPKGDGMPSKFKNLIQHFIYLNKDTRTIFLDDTPLFSVDKLPQYLQAPHNLYNLMLALGATVIPYDVSPTQALTVLQNFKGLYGRLQYITTINNVAFYNDTAATMSKATEYTARALTARFPKVVIIMGGQDKGEDYTNLIKALKGTGIHALVLFEGDASEKLENLAQQHNIPTYGKYGDIKQAVAKAYELARPNGAVVLSPAAASFNMFLNEWERGAKFDAAVKELKHQENTKA